MKKYLPLIILGLGVLVFVVVLVINKVRKPEVVDTNSEETSLIELKLEQMPVVSLTPTDDGHYLYLKVTKIKIEGAVSMDFQFLYDVPDKVQQGSSGDNIDITSGTFETDLLLGSESAGKFRYDEGVEKGNIILWFRDRGSKLITKVETDFHMLQNPDEITSNDDKFSFLPDNKGIYVVMNTLGIPDGYSFSTEDIEGPYGVFSAQEDMGTAKLIKQNIFVYNGSWVESNKGLGIYVATD